MKTNFPSTESPAPDLVVLSDLHLGEGFLPEHDRYSPMEDFFFDDAFARLLANLTARYDEDPSRLVLVLNGDVFDFLTQTSIPDRNVSKEAGVTVSDAELKFGLNPTATKSTLKLDAIIGGHRVFFSALASFIGRGHRVEILRGNHDLELFFEEVQIRLLEKLAGFENGPSLEQARKRVGFHQWFYLEPGRVYIEHGNQYESSNSIRYPLNPIMDRGPKGESEEVLDYPLGSLFVRYFYNRVHHLDPYTPKVISFEQYLEFIRRYNLLDLLKVAKDHYPFFMAALKPQAAKGRSRSTSKGDAEQEAAFDSLEKSTKAGDLYRKLDRLKVHPMAASKMALVREMSKPILKRILWYGGTAIATLYTWLLVFNVIQAPIIFESVFAKATLLFFFSLLTLIAVLWIGNHLNRKLRRRRDETVETCARSADEIARLTGVKLVLMGHTHVVDVRKLAGGKATYANSGTWTSVDNPWNQLVPDARRLSLLYVKGDHVQVCRWNDDAGRIDPVPLFYLADDRGRDRSQEASRTSPVLLRPRTWRRLSTFQEGDDSDPDFPPRQ